jgi:hypothetical protein
MILGWLPFQPQAMTHPQEGQAKRNVAFVDRIKEEQFNSS